MNFLYLCVVYMSVLYCPVLCVCNVYVCYVCMHAYVCVYLKQIVIDHRMESIIEQMFLRCFRDSCFEQAIGKYYTLPNCTVRAVRAC
jgi:hypothetical protein